MRCAFSRLVLMVRSLLRVVSSVSEWSASLSSKLSADAKYEVAAPGGPRGRELEDEDEDDEIDDRGRYTSLSFLGSKPMGGEAGVPGSLSDEEEVVEVVEVRVEEEADEEHVLVEEEEEVDFGLSLGLIRN